MAAPKLLLNWGFNMNSVYKKSRLLTIGTLLSCCIISSSLQAQDPPSDDPTGDIVRGALDDTWRLYNATEDLYRNVNFRAIWTIGTDPQAFVYLREAKTELSLAKSYLDDAEDAWDAYVTSGNNNILLAVANDTNNAHEHTTEAGVKILLADQLVSPEGPGGE